MKNTRLVYGLSPTMYNDIYTTRSTIFSIFAFVVCIDEFDIAAIFELKTKDSMFVRRSSFIVRVKLFVELFFDYDLMAVINVSNLITKVVLWFVLIFSMLRHPMNQTRFHVLNSLHSSSHRLKT